MYNKAIITKVNNRTNANTGDYVQLQFEVFDEDTKTNTIGYKNFYINHLTNPELKLKATQMLFRMKKYFASNPNDVDNDILIGKKCFVEIIENNKFKNIGKVYFIMEIK